MCSALSAIHADITILNINAIVHAANESLLPGGGVCGRSFVTPDRTQTGRTIDAVVVARHPLGMTLAQAKEHIEQSANRRTPSS